MSADLLIYYPNGGTLANQMYIWDGSKPVLWDGSVTFSGSLPSTVAGNKSNNAAAPTSDNVGALTAIANASAPTWTEGRQVLLSTDLSGSLRVAATISTVGLATSAKQDTGNTSLASIDTKTPALGQALAAASVPVVLTALQLTALTPPAAITNYALETGGNLATLAGIISSARAAVNLISGQAGVTGGSGVVGAAVQRVVLATDVALPTGSNVIGHVIVDTVPSNQSINIAQINGTTTVNGGSAAGIMAVGGPNATNVAITGNPTNLGAQAVSSENSAVTTARQVQLVADLVGKLIVLPYANPENFVSGAITTAITNTTSTSLIASPGGSLRNYITQITVSNSHATVGTDVIIQDGSGGTTLYTIPAAAVYGGATVTFPTPLRQPTTATAIFCANVTTGASTKISASGYKGL